SATALTSDSLGGSSMRYARALDVELPEHFTLWAQGGYDLLMADGTMFGTLDTHITALAFTGGARLRYQRWSYVAASAVLAAGPENARVSLTASNSNSASDHGWGAIGLAALQLDLLAYDTSSFSFGMRFELGYVAATGVGITPKRSKEDGVLQIPTME